MISVLMFLSDAIIPLLIFYIVGFGILMKKNVYDEFVDGAVDGFKTVVKIMPTLIGLMIAVGILRASGFLDWFSAMCSGVTKKLGFPSELLPVALVKMFSSSAATGLTVDIFKQYGPDSRLGSMVSIMMSSTETIFYTLSIYFMTIKVRKTRWTLAGALLASVTGIAMSVVLAGMM